MFYNGKIINNNYFNNYQEFQYLLNPKCIYTINESNSGVNSLLLIDKFKLCASYDDGLIKIFDLNNYNCLYILEGHSSPVLSISLMLNKNIISGSCDKKIKIWELKNDKYINIKTIEGHEDTIEKVIQLKNSIIVSCSADGNIRFWNENNNYKCVKTLNVNDENISSLLEINNNKIVAGTVKLFTGKIMIINSNFQIETIFNGITCNWNNGLQNFDNDRILICSNTEIYILNIKTMFIEKILNQRIYIGPVYKLNDEIIAIGFFDESSFKLINYKTNEICSEIKGEHKQEILGIIKINNEKFATCSKDNTVKIWTY